MPKEHLQPPGLMDSRKFGFTQVVASPPGRLVFVSGQTALDAAGQVEGGDDLAAQAEAALRNLAIALESAGATPADLTSLRVYIVDYDPSKMVALGAPMAGFLGDSEPPAQTWIGVQALAMPGLQVEVEAMAVVE